MAEQSIAGSGSTFQTDYWIHSIYQSENESRIKRQMKEMNDYLVEQCRAVNNLSSSSRKA